MATNGNKVRNPDFRIMQLFTALSGKFKRTWCYPSQAKILALLEKYYGRTMSPRTLNRHLRALQDEMYIKRIRRHIRHPRQGIIFRSTVYVLGARWGSRLRRQIKAMLSWSNLPGKSIDLFRLPSLAEYRKILI